MKHKNTLELLTFTPDEWTTFGAPVCANLPHHWQRYDESAGTIIDRFNRDDVVLRVSRNVANEVVDWHKRVRRTRLARVWAPESSNCKQLQKKHC